MDSLNDKHKKTKITNGNQFLEELIKNQLDNVQEDKKLYLQDMRRICKNIKSNPFDKEKCCIWDGYITNLKKKNKGTYINFYFRKKKLALHRLLYENYVETLTPDYYLKYTCPNKGKCCNVNHLKKFKYKKKKTIVINTKPNKKTTIKNNGIIKFW